VRRHTRLSLLTASTLFAVTTLAAQERIDQDAVWKMRQEGTARSQIMATLHMLADVYGPRLTGSPQLKAAGEWARDQMRAWGLTNAHLEPWEFGHPGWTNERVTAHIVAPVQDALVVEVLAWTPGTPGVRRGKAVQITLPARPTRDDLTKHLDGLKDAVRGRMVLVGAPTRVPVTFNAPPLRREDTDVVSSLAAPPAPNPPAAGAGRGGRGGAPAAPVPLTANEVEEQVNLFLAANGVLVRINDAGRDHGQIRAFNNRTFDVAKAPPTLVMRNEDYGRISRLVAGGRDVQLEVEIVNRTHSDGSTAYNVVAEIPGTDKADEVVMLGAHLDSWHAATGATDNAIGSAIMMDAARILAATGVKPRRTIRVALWSGEEQGLLGSQAYVKEHFGMAEQPKPEFATFAGYFNVDNGTGRPRGFTVFGPAAAGAILRDVAAPLADLGVLGATTTRSRVRGGSDHTSFNEAGLPGITVMQDPIQYGTYTWHTNLDTYERVVEDDAKKAAIAVAAAVYHLAMRNDLLPRFTATEMPRRPGTDPAPAPATAPAGTPAPAPQSR
jgi:hypothetical protein